MMKSAFVLYAVLAVSLLTGCTTVDITSRYAGPPLPMPEQLLVYDLAVTQEEVRLDDGLSALAIEAMKSASRSEQEIEAGRKVAADLSKELVKELQKLGLPASRAEGEMSMDPGVVHIFGQFLSIDEGNRTERVVIGLGAGRSDVRADVQMRDDGQTLETFDGTAKSGRGPGMAETLGVGGLTGRLLASAVITTAVKVTTESAGVTVEADAHRMARKIVAEAKPFFIRQGWISED